MWLDRNLIEGTRIRESGNFIGDGFSFVEIEIVLAPVSVNFSDFTCPKRPFPYFGFDFALSEAKDFFRGSPFN